MPFLDGGGHCFRVVRQFVFGSVFVTLVRRRVMPCRGWMPVPEGGGGGVQIIRGPRPLAGRWSRGTQMVSGSEVPIRVPNKIRNLEGALRVGCRGFPGQGGGSNCIEARQTRRSPEASSENPSEPRGSRSRSADPVGSAREGVGVLYATAAGQRCAS